MALTDYHHIDSPLIQEKRITYDSGGWVKTALVLDVGNCVGGEAHLVYGDIVEWKWNGRTRIDTFGPEDTQRRDRILKGLKENRIDGYVGFV